MTTKLTVVEQEILDEIKDDPATLHYKYTFTELSAAIQVALLISPDSLVLAAEMEAERLNLEKFLSDNVPSRLPGQLKWNLFNTPDKEE
jgi:hypothetical protein